MQRIDPSGTLCTTHRRGPTIKAKEVLKDKFWIVEEGGESFATISWDKENYSKQQRRN